MKNLKYYILFFVGVFLMQSCLHEEEDIFGKSSAQRLNEAQKYYEKVLTSAPNGWILEFIAGDTDANRRGAFNFLLKFENGNVTASVDKLALSDINPTSTEPYKKITSLYRFDQDMSVTISFSTYNSFLHYYHEQHGSYTTYKGDFEFTIMEAYDDLVILRGKKYGNIMEMHRLPEDVTWEKYLENVNNVIEDTGIYAQFELQSNGQKIGEGTKNTNSRYSFTLTDNVVVGSNAVYTQDGLKFVNPLNVNNKELQNFVWDPTTKTYKCTDNGAGDIIIVAIPDPSYMYYEQIPGTYSFSYISDYLSGNVKKERTVTIEEDVKGMTFKMTGGFDWPIALGYDKFNGCFTIRYQQVATSSGGDPVVLWAFNGVGSLYQDAVLSGVFNGDTTTPAINIKDLSGSSTGFSIIRRAADGNWLTRDSGGDFAFNNILMKRKP